MNPRLAALLEADSWMYEGMPGVLWIKTEDLYVLGTVPPEPPEHRQSHYWTRLQQSDVFASWCGECREALGRRRVGWDPAYPCACGGHQGGRHVLPWPVPKPKHWWPILMPLGVIVGCILLTLLLSALGVSGPVCDWTNPGTAQCR